jgi:HK97 family phage portal protein
MGAISPENPRFSLNDPMAWDLFGTPSSTGIAVTSQKALTYSPWYRGLTLLARDVGKLPLFVYQRTDGGKERATDHAAYYPLRFKPNSFQTALQFRQQLTGHAISGGNGYAYISRLGDATLDPEDPLLPLDPQETYPVRENGKLWYVTKINHELRKLLPDSILHIPGFGFDGLCGIGVLEVARDAIGLGLGSQRYQAATLRNAGRPPIILEHPLKMAEPAKRELRDSWQAMHSGIDNAGKTAILDGGLKANQLSFTPEDMEFVAQQKMTVRDIANFLHVPPHKLGDDGRTAYASLEQENQSYLSDGLDYWLRVWEGCCWDKLLTEAEKRADSHVVEFRREDMAYADLAALTNYLRTATAGRPWMLPDEARNKMNMNPLGGTAGEYLDPLNMGQGGPDNQPENPNEPPPGRPPKSGAHRAMIADYAWRAAKRLGQHAVRAAGKPREFTDWLAGLAEQQRAPIAEVLRPGVVACNALTSHTHTSEEAALALIRAAGMDLERISGDVTAAGLLPAVEAWAVQFERDYPSELAGWWFPEEH